jgi:hypothetical protein
MTQDERINQIETELRRLKEVINYNNGVAHTKAQEPEKALAKLLSRVTKIEVSSGRKGPYGFVK